MSRVAYCLFPGSTRSGEKARKKSVPALSPPRSRIGRRFQDDQLSRAQVRRRRLDRAHHEGEVRVAGLPERRGHADVHDVQAGDVPVVGRAAQVPRLDHLAQFLVGNVGDIAVPAVDAGDLVGIDVDAPHVEPAAGELGGQRKADVAQPHDADTRLPGNDPFLQIHG
jgi:hypothetical protein